MTRKGEILVICIMIVAAALPFLVIFGVHILKDEIISEKQIAGKNEYGLNDGLVMKSDSDVKIHFLKRSEFGWEGKCSLRAEASVIINGGKNVIQEDCICFSIRSGERVSDLLFQLEKKGITSYKTFQKIAREVEFTAYSFVPTPSDNVNRFEGLFAPGEYVLSNYFRQSRNTNQEYEITLFIVGELLERSRERYKVLRQKENLSIYDQIILASIVEKEAVIEKKHGMIASVFLNRLAMNIPIASCPTVEYSLGYHRPFLIMTDLNIDSPYNVYWKRGLPPTPIAFFDDEALQSIINTPRTKYLFFVYDWTEDELYFSENYFEHQKNIALSKANYTRFYGQAALYKMYPDKFYEH